MNQLSKVFDGHELTSSENDGEPNFLLKDVCNILEIGNPTDVKNRLEDGVVSIEVIQDRLGRNQKATFVNEDGLYDVILDSRKPEAKRFRKWITSKVIPSIRKHGAYATPDTIENIISDPEFGIQLLTNLKEEKELHRKERLKRERAERKIEQQKPKVVFAESCLVSQDSVLVKDVAKLASNQ